MTHLYQFNTPDLFNYVHYMNLVTDRDIIYELFVTYIVEVRDNLFTKSLAPSVW